MDSAELVESDFIMLSVLTIACNVSVMYLYHFHKILITILTQAVRAPLGKGLQDNSLQLLHKPFN